MLIQRLGSNVLEASGIGMIMYAAMTGGEKVLAAGFAVLIVGGMLDEKITKLYK